MRDPFCAGGPNAPGDHEPLEPCYHCYCQPAPPEDECGPSTIKCSGGRCPLYQTCEPSESRGGCECVSVPPPPPPKPKSQKGSFACSCVDPKVLPADYPLRESLWKERSGTFFPLLRAGTLIGSDPQGRITNLGILGSYNVICKSEGDPAKCKTERKAQASVRLWSQAGNRVETWHQDNEVLTDAFSPEIVMRLGGRFSYGGTDWARDDAFTKSDINGASVTVKSRNQVIEAGHPSPQQVREALTDPIAPYFIFQDMPHFTIAIEGIPRDNEGLRLSRYLKTIVTWDPPTKRTVCVTRLIQGIKLTPMGGGGYSPEFSQQVEKVSCGIEEIPK